MGVEIAARYRENKENSRYSILAVIIVNAMKEENKNKKNTQDETP